MNWNEVLQLTQSNPSPPNRVEKTNEEWKQILTAEQFHVTRQHGTEHPFSGEYCEAYGPGVYTCICCDTALFDSTEKFDSRTGWPSFREPVKNNVIKYKMDNSYGVQRVEVLCNVCDAHLGHVFPDGPPPSGLRFCINSVSMRKTEDEEGQDAQALRVLETTTLGGGCFWCTEAIMNELEGVIEVTSGYSGGTEHEAKYRIVSSGATDHAECTQVRFNPQIISYADLLRIFLATHNPTSLNRQGADIGRQYRSVIFYHDEGQMKTARDVIKEMQSLYDQPIVTEVVPYTAFYLAEPSHREYYKNNPEKTYCQLVINPKLQKLRSNFNMAIKKSSVAP